MSSRTPSLSSKAASKAAPKGQRKDTPKADPQRVLAVWASLVAAMTLVAGGLWLASGKPVGPVRPMMEVASVAPGAFEPVFSSVQTPIPRGRWQAIVIHDSGAAFGTTALLDAQARGQGLRGIGYHFLVGNGNGLRDGQVEVCPRWLDQESGAHAAGQDADWFNRHAIGICLIGDGDRERFSTQQVARTLQLVQVLCDRLGIAPDRVYLHSQIGPTTSPGRYFPEAELRRHMQSR